jgi:hypothetical protein
MPTYVIKCRVTLDGADMIVQADDEVDAMRKAKSGDWDDIEYDGASVADCDVTGKPKQDD